MTYTLSVESFKNTFAVKLDGSNGLQLTHNHAKRFNLFPYNTSNSDPITELSPLIGKYLGGIDGEEPIPLSADVLIEKLKRDENLAPLKPDAEEIFEQVVRHMFFDKDGKIRPINLRMLAQISCTDSNECKLADYLVDVLGDREILKKSISEASAKVDAQSNALERFVATKLEFKPIKHKSGPVYYRITNSLKSHFERDFTYILGARNRTRDYLVPLIEFYYFTYTAQAILQLNRFLDGCREECIPIYFCLEWEKTSQSRPCFQEGWNMLQVAISKIFAHSVVLEILNQTVGENEPVDYIKISELINCIPGEDHRIAEEIKTLTDCYRQAVADCREMGELTRRESLDGETAAEIKFLFDSVRVQFENMRSGPYNKYANKFIKYCDKKYLKPRGRSGKMLNISEETLIFLTKICIKDKEKMRLNDVFSEFESRGVFLDNHSKNEVMHYYEKLNLIEKKSDSGDAQYVKRIL